MLAAAAALGWLGWSRSPALVATPDQNVLLVTIDTLRADALGGYGGAAATPVLDGLARRGLRFDFAHAHAVVTLPSHASILTGRFPFEHGIRDNTGYRLAPGTPTLATLLRAQGFATGAFVSAFVLDSRFGLDAGFDVYDDRLRTSDAPTDIAIPERRGEEVVARARAWLATQQGRWFAWVHLFDPHAPYAPPPLFDAAYAGRPYLGEVAYVDHVLGPLVADLERLADRPTLVVATADHGEALGDHGEITHGLFAYEPTLRVPLIVAQLGGGRVPRDVARSSQAPVSHVDILPTVLGLLGLAPPPGLPGRSLLDAREDDRTRASYFEAMTTALNRGWAPLSGVLVGREKLIDLPIPELYDLEADPREARNLYDAAPDRRRVLEARLRGLGATPPGSRQAEPREVVERLQALGYVSGEAPQRTTYTEEDDPKRLVDIERQIHEGVAQIEQGRLAEARATYRRVLAARPDIPVAYRHLAFVHWQAGDPAGAIAVLREAFGRGLASRALRAQLGTYLAEAGSPGEAIALLEDLEREEVPDLDSANALGIAYARAGRTREALAVFDRVLAADPDNAIALQNAGSALLAQGHVEAARERFLKAVAADPALARAYTGLGVAEQRAGRREAAIDAWRRAVGLDAREFDALYNLAVALLDAERPEEARPVAERFVREAPGALYAAEIEELRRVLR
jgi:arylsulfatase A-like enzyme/tetratricopeptide (TPR) repeat protein